MNLIEFVARYWLEFGIAIAISVATWKLDNFLAQKRANVLIAVVHQLGFTFDGDNWNQFNRVPQLETPLFERGREKVFRNIMTGSRAGLLSSYFDYSFVGGKRPIKQTVATFSDDVWLPLFEVVPRNIIRKLGDSIVRKDVHFESHPRFSKRFQVRSLEGDKVRALFTSELLSYFESLDPKMKWHVEGCGLTLVIYRLGKIVKPAEFVEFVEQTTAIAKAFFTLSGLKTFKT